MSSCSRGMALLVACQLATAGAFWAGRAGAAKIACVGDSITFGYGLGDPDTESYPAVLQELLGTEHAVSNFGVSGATLLESGDRPYRSEARFSDSDAFAPDIVIVMLGTNDSKPQNWANSAAFAADYEELIDHYRALGAIVYVTTPPHVFDAGAFDISPGVVENDVVPLVQQVASEAGAPLVDVFTVTADQGALFPDTVHPNAAGARLIAETVEAALAGRDLASSTGSGGSTAAATNAVSAGGTAGSPTASTVGAGGGPSTVSTSGGAPGVTSTAGSPASTGTPGTTVGAGAMASDTVGSATMGGGPSAATAAASGPSMGSNGGEDPTDDGAGCGCRIGGHRGHPVVALAPVLLPLARRRRHRRPGTSTH